MLQKKNEGNFLSAEIRVVGSYTDRFLKWFIGNIWQYVSESHLIRTMY